MTTPSRPAKGPAGNRSPQVSVVIPTHNRADLLPATLASVYAQRDVDLEVVVVDDGSRDTTPQLLDRQDDARLHVVRHEQPQGVVEARNAGIAAAKGTWVAFLDDDDLWFADKLRLQMTAAQESDRVWAYGAGVHFVEGPRLWGLQHSPSARETMERLPHECLIPPGASNVLARRDVVNRLGGFAEDLEHLADWDLWLRLLEVGLPAVVEEFVMAYRLHPSNMALDSAEGLFREVEIIDRRYRHLRDGRPLDPTPVYFWLARAYWRSGQPRQARKVYWEAFRAGNPRALVRVLRTFVPMHRLRPAQSWPPGMESWLRHALGRQPASLAEWDRES